MRLLTHIPSDALAAGSSIAGVGATPEGIDQNPVYYEYMFDSAWHMQAQSLDEWFNTYSSRRYGNTDNADAMAAWKILQTAVYTSQAGGFHDDTGIEWNALSEAPHPTGIDVKQVYAAWQHLVKAASVLDVHEYATLNYDIVNVGREVLAQLISTFERSLTAAVSNMNKTEALMWGDVVLDTYTDLDEITGCDNGFLLGPWISAAKVWANSSDAPESYYEWQARSQVSTWWPVAPSALNSSATFNSLPILDNYANKHWNGLIRDFYARRVQCYVNQVNVDIPNTPQPTPTCSLAAKAVTNSYLKGYPYALNNGSIYAPTKWPYNTSSLDAAEAWCCRYTDCGGVTYQTSHSIERYEVRAGSSPIGNSGSSSYPRKETSALNHANLTKCVVEAELSFTQGSGGDYLQKPTVDKTVALATSLIAKYAKYL